MKSVAAARQEGNPSYLGIKFSKGNSPEYFFLLLDCDIHSVSDITVQHNIIQHFEMKGGIQNIALSDVS